MSSQDAWFATNGRHIYSRMSYERTYWDRIVEPSILVPVLVLLATVFYSSGILASFSDRLPPSLLFRLWNFAVTILPASLLFAIDDWLSPIPLPHAPMNRLGAAALHEAKSAALSRIIGRNASSSGGGIMASVSYAGKTGLSRLIPRGAIDRPAGLGNLNNSCYQNSVLQSLAALEPFREYLSWVTDEEQSGGLPPTITAHTLGQLIRVLYGSEENGETLWTPPVLKRMSTFQQQDAQEYFCKLLNEIQEELEKALKEAKNQPGFESDLSLSPKDDSDDSQHSEDSGYQSASYNAKHAASVASAFRIPLEGLVAQRIVCRSCGYSSGLSMSPFYCLTLNLGSISSEYRLEELLDSFSAVENIEGVHCASCTLIRLRDRIRIIIGRFEVSRGLDSEAGRRAQPVPYERLDMVETALEDEDFEEKTLSEKCKVPAQQKVDSTKTRQVGIARAPPSIAFHINRSRFDENTGYTFKNPASIRFPLQLDLGPWCLGSAATRSLSSTGSKAGQVLGSDLDLDSDQERAPSDESNEDMEEWQLPPQLPMVAGSQYRSKITGPVYELRAVITHYGQHENGHYVCFRKHPIPPKPIPVKDDQPPQEAEVNMELNEAEDAEDQKQEEEPNLMQEYLDSKPEEPQWWRLSDQNVSLSSEGAVLAQGGVFMLFYDRIDANSILAGADEKVERDGEVTDEKLDGQPNGSPHQESAVETPSNLLDGEPVASITDDGKKINYDLLEAVLAEAKSNSS